MEDQLAESQEEVRGVDEEPAAEPADIRSA
jgi:hypothetical protein